MTNAHDTDTQPITAGAGTEDCPSCGAVIPLPLANFCRQCRYPLRVDSYERAARLGATWFRR